MIKKVILLVFSCCVTLSLFSRENKENQGEISRVEIKKISGDIHFSGSYDCNEYDRVFKDMSIDQPVLDTAFNDKHVTKKFHYLFSEFEKYKDKCHGRPQIKISLIFKDSTTTVFYLEQYAYLMTEKGTFLIGNKFISEDDELRTFLTELGGFR